MARVYKTARGQSVDMDKVRLGQETTNAVGNMRVNARGDIIGAGGKVATGRNQIMDQVYAVPDAGYSPNDPVNFKQQQSMMENSKAQALHDLASNLVTPAPAVEQTAPAQPATPPARGSLAGSVAKTVSVNQAPTPTPQEQKKSNGPSRI
jgi:hypothetical protein